MQSRAGLHPALVAQRPYPFPIGFCGQRSRMASVRVIAIVLLMVALAGCAGYWAAMEECQRAARLAGYDPGSIAGGQIVRQCVHDKMDGVDLSKPARVCANADCSETREQ